MSAERSSNVEHLQQNDVSDNSNSVSVVTEETIVKLDEQATTKKIEYLDNKVVWHEQSIAFYKLQSEKYAELLEELRLDYDRAVVPLKDSDQKKLEFRNKKALLEGEKWSFDQLVQKQQKKLVFSRASLTSAKQRVIDIEEGRGAPKNAQQRRDFWPWILEGKTGAAIAQSTPIGSPSRNPYTAQHARRYLSNPVLEPASPQRISARQGNAIVVSPASGTNRKEAPSQGRAEIGKKRAREDDLDSGISDEAILEMACNAREEDDDHDEPADEISV
jgi:hypothetical protein